jgi:[acyl-carrier-protein] S-malonyltransferase
MSKRVGLLFPGQGSQFVGMGRELLEASVGSRDLFDEADAHLGYSLSKIMLEGPDELLRETHHTQPALYLHSAACWNLLSTQGLEIAAAAGHSLGEYSALYAAGALRFLEGLEVVRLRGRLMFQTGVERPGAMAAILGIDSSVVEDVARNAASETGLIVQPANFNAPSQTVLSGEVQAIEHAMVLAKSAGARRAIRLPVSGAFHSALMLPAAEELGRRLRTVDWQAPLFPVVANVTAAPVAEAAEIPALLTQQLTRPVRWVEALQTMLADGIHTFLEVGPKTVLSGLVKKVDRRASCHSVSDLESLEKALEAVAV